MFRWLDRIFAAVAGVATASLVIAILFVAADIIVRKTMARSLVGAVDVTELVVLVSAFLAIPAVFMRGGHVAVEILTDPLPLRARALFDGLGALLGAAMFLVIGLLSFKPMQLSAGAGDVSQDLAIPILAFWIPMIAGCFLAAIAGVAAALHKFMIVAGRLPS